jgi:hypothetical protein
LENPTIGQLALFIPVRVAANNFIQAPDVQFSIGLDFDISSLRNSLVVCLLTLKKWSRA